MTKRGGRANRPEERVAAEALAVAALAFIAAEPERLGRFLAMSGIGPIPSAPPPASRNFFSACSIILPPTSRY